MRSFANLGRLAAGGGPSVLEGFMDRARAGRLERAIRGLLALSAVGITGAARAEPPRLVPQNTGVRGTLAQPLSKDPTTVLGLFWYPVGYAPYFFDQSRPVGAAALPVGTTGSVGLVWMTQAPANGGTITTTFTDTQHGLQFIWNDQFVFYPPNTACDITVITDSLGGYYGTYYNCLFASSLQYVWFGNVGVLYLTCSRITTWAVKMTGTDPGANFLGSFNIGADGVRPIVRDAPSVLSTALPYQSGGTSIVEPAVPGGTNQLIVQALDSLCPNQLVVPGVQLQAKITYASGSGGHTHATQPLPANMFPNVLAVTPLGGATFDPAQGLLSGISDSLGQVKAGLQAGVASADLSVTASSPLSASTDTRPISLDPNLGLEPVPAIAFDSNPAEGLLYYLTGGLGQKCNGPTYCNRHADNHYMTRGALLNVQRFAGLVKVYSGGGGANSIGGGITVGLDDMSLVKGGVFDLSGNFAQLPVGHITHRRGHDVDIVWVVTNVGRQFEPAKPWEELLWQAAFDADGEQVDETPIHFRFPD